MLRQRVITALVAFAALLIVLFVLPATVAQVVIALLVLAGAWEWSRFLGTASVPVRAAFVAAVFALMALIAAGLPAIGEPVFLVSLLWWAAAFVWVFFFPTPVPGPLRWAGGLLVLVPLFVALVVLYRTEPQVLLFALLIVWAADVGAYFTGKQFGRVKLAPKISPGKTWEGVIGGMAAVVVVTLCRSLLVETDLMVWMPFCVAVASASIVGDLTVSMFKRTAGMKDSGSVFPGHGGVLDRIDSVAAAVPLFALGIGWIGVQ